MTDRKQAKKSQTLIIYMSVEERGRLDSLAEWLDMGRSTVLRALMNERYKQEKWKHDESLEDSAIIAQRQ